MPSLYTFQNLNLRLDVIHKDDRSENANIFSEYPQEMFFFFKGFDSSEGKKYFDLRKCDQRICDRIKLCRDISKMFDSCTKAMLVEISFG